MFFRFLMKRTYEKLAFHYEIPIFALKTRPRPLFTSIPMTMHIHLTIVFTRYALPFSASHPPVAALLPETISKGGGSL